MIEKRKSRFKQGMRNIWSARLGEPAEESEGEEGGVEESAPEEEEEGGRRGGARD